VWSVGRYIELESRAPQSNSPKEKYYKDFSAPLRTSKISQAKIDQLEYKGGARPGGAATKQSDGNVLPKKISSSGEVKKRQPAMSFTIPETAGWMRNTQNVQSEWSSPSSWWCKTAAPNATANTVMTAMVNNLTLA